MLEDRLADADAVGLLFRDDFRKVIGLFGLVKFHAASVGQLDFADDLIFGELRGGVLVVVVEDEVDFELRIELEPGIEGFVELRFESSERANEFFREKLGGFGLGEQAPGDVFLRLEFALGLTALVGGIGLAQAFRAADRTIDIEVGKRLVLRVIGALLCLADDFFGVGIDLAHELVAFEFALLHEVQFVLPIAGESGRIKPFDFHVAHQLDEPHAAVADMQIAPFAGHVLL